MGQRALDIIERLIEHQAKVEVRFGQLIEEARQERLSTIDSSAAAEQERVEQIEREYLERLERERSAPLPGEVDPASEGAAEPEAGPKDEPEG